MKKNTHAPVLDPNALQIALEYHQAGQFSQAEALYQQILQHEPNNPDALHFLGVLAYQRGQHAVAVEWMNKAISVCPTASAIYSNLGLALQALGKLDQAIKNYRDALSLQPDYIEARNNLANAFLTQNNIAAAIENYRYLLLLKPDDAQIQHQLSLLLKKQEQSAETEFRPDEISVKPGSADAYNQLGMTQQAEGNLNAALDSYQQAIVINPDCAHAYYNLGNLFHYQGKLDQAAKSYHQALALKLDYIEAWNGLGVVFYEQFRVDEAIKCCHFVLSLHPDDAVAYYNLGNIFHLQAKLDMAIEHFQKALLLQSGYVEAENRLFNSQLHCCDWSAYFEGCEKIVSSVRAGKKGCNPFTFLAISQSAAAQQQCASTWIADKYPLSKTPVVRKQGYSHDKIRIAYVSDDFREHPTAYLIVGLLEQHDRERFELIAISLNPEDNSITGQRVKKAFDQFIDVSQLGNEEIAALMADLEIDIAIDLMGLTRFSRPAIFSYRPAPIQVNYLGYAGTMGAEYMDYILADPYLIPAEHQVYYTEKVVYLPDSYQVNDSKRRISKHIPTRTEVGLPKKDFVFCCFNNNYKITPQVFEIWMRLLGKVENSVLWLLEDNPFASGNLRKEAVQRGIAAERLIFAERVPLDAHLARHKQADLFLDTLFYNAHTTTSDALWAGLPVLTCMGDSFASRVAGCLLHAIGLPELITHNLAEYEELAFTLATTPKKLAEIKAKLAKNRSIYPLFDTDRFRRHIESAYITMWERYQRGEGPASFAVQPILTKQVKPLDSAIAALFQTAMQHHQAGQLPQAEAGYQRILQIDPTHVDTLHFLGVLAHQQGNNQRAIALINQAINLNPAHAIPAMYCNLGTAYQAQAEFDNAIRNFQQALSLNPDYAEAHYNLGVVLHLTDKLDQAIASYRRAILINPDYPQAYHNLGGVLEDKGEAEEALLSYQQALSIKPDYLEVYLNLGPLLLSLGRYSEGWPLLEYRYHPDIPIPWAIPPKFDFPQWQGQSLTGKSLAIWSEQGFGDGIQFCRYVTLLKEQGAAFISLVCRSPLKSLFEKLSGVDKVLTFEEALAIQKHDYWTFSMSIPLHCQTTAENIPATVPYLYADPKQAESIALELKPVREFKVGICWKGNPQHKGDLQRSLDIRLFKPLFELSEVKFFTLQPGTRDEFISVAGTAAVDIGREINETSFEEAAAVIANLDLVISCDTSLAHLAGALGKPVWLVVAFNAEWRWLKKREDSPWYPTVRIFRQAERGNWEELINRVADRLKAVLAGSSAVLWPIKTLAFEQAHSYFQVGNDLLGQGKIELAIENYRQAVTIRPDFADAYCNLGVALKEQGELDAAIESYRHALSITPDDAEIYSNLGEVFWKQGKLDAAIEAYQQALALNPQVAEVYNNLGVAFKDQKKFEKAIESYQQALTLNPDYFEAYNKLGDVFTEQGKLDKAIECYHRALVVGPRYAEAYNNLGNAFYFQGQWDKALENYRQAVQLKPEYAIAHYNLGLLLLSFGQYEEGWQHCEYRSKTEKSSSIPPKLNFPQWQGESLAGKAILICPEQGYGDQIQFCRYVSVLKNMGAKFVGLVCAKPLKPLLETHLGLDQILNEYETHLLREYDYWTFPLSIPFHCQTRIENIPGGLNCLSVIPERVAYWKSKIPVAKLKVGLVWKGSSHHDNDKNRSLAHLRTLSPLFEIADVAFISLQKGQGENEPFELLPTQLVTHLGLEINDFADSAAIVSQLDLLVCVDTAIAHLAGMLGKPVWLLVPFISDWRWIKNREDNPWYPTMRLFWQTESGNWEEVISLVAAQLKKVASADSSFLIHQTNKAGMDNSISS